MSVKLTPFTQLSGAFRARIVKTWHISSDLSPAEAAAHLNDVAVEHSFVRRAKPVPGAALAEWGRSGVTPLWAALAALVLLLKTGWRPASDEEWAGFAALYIQLCKSKELAVLTVELPASIDQSLATGWLCAAIEEDERYLLTKKVAS
ncbi:hypothetical protein J1782_01735 [Rahnella sp. BCC 1045]|uniref:hypothetical protein n=1 Tax=Rahnella sp. BCC 1045 TaxID=2816251 RepID=UPI001C2529C9|nr:hypothetical protein [Rahnella sp. BCC 1045]MBU9818611.1 hypothetical protein [Rahnella sp. BCC 1045]